MLGFTKLRWRVKALWAFLASVLKSDWRVDDYPVNTRSHDVKTNESLPRPRTKVPVQFAPTDRVDRHDQLVVDFVNRVLQRDWAWISNESSLFDFHCDKTNDRLNEKIKLIYGVDVSDISNGNIADILDRIATTTDATPIN